MKEYKKKSSVEAEAIVKSLQVIASNRALRGQNAYGDSPAWGHQVDLHALVKTRAISRIGISNGSERIWYILDDPKGGKNPYYGWEVNPKGDRICRPSSDDPVKHWWGVSAVFSRLLRMKENA